MRQSGGEMTAAQEEELTLYEGHVPDFVEAELDRLYGVRYSTWPHFTTQYAMATASTFTMSHHGKRSTVLLFSIRKNVLTVLNEGIRMDAFTMAKFTGFMFGRMGQLAAICMNAIEAETAGLTHPYYRAACASDMVMALPSGRDWMSTLSAQYRSQVRRNIRRMQALDPSFVFELHEKQAVDLLDIHAIIDLNKARMAGKKKKATIDASERQNIVHFVRERGFVGVIRMNGALRAGVILYKLGNNYALRILAHDAAYDHYSIGVTALVLTIERASERQCGGTFYFGWGDEAYKARLGARKRELSRLIIYRTPRSLLQTLPLTVNATHAATVVRVRQWLHSMRRTLRAGTWRSITSSVKLLRVGQLFEGKK
jgi:hypothetical protein